MALLFMEGFDCFSTLLNTSEQVRTALWQFADGLTLTTNTRYGRGKAVRSTASSVYGCRRVINYDPATLIVGVAVKVEPDLDIWGTQFFLFEDATVGGGRYAQLMIGTDPKGRLTLMTGDADILQGFVLRARSDRNVFIESTWYYIEVKATFHRTHGHVEVMVDEALVLVYDGPTVSQSGAARNSANTIFFTPRYAYSLGSGIGGTTYDDIYCCDLDPAGVNYFLGDISVESFFVQADVGPNAMIPLTGTSHAAMLQSYDEDTTFVFTNTIGDMEQFSLPDLPDDIIQVRGVAGYARGKKDAMSTTNFDVGLVLGGTYKWSGGQQLSTSYITRELFMELKHDEGTWTISDINALQLAFRTVSG